MPIAGALSGLGYRQRAAAPTTGNPLFAQSVSRRRAASGANTGAVVKYDRNGRPGWIATVDYGAGSGVSTVFTGIATRSNRDIVAAGYSGNSGSTLTANFYHGDGSLGATLSMVGIDGFLVYYEWTGGYIQWVARISSGSSDYIYNMGLDTSGNVYVGGQGGAITAYNADGSSGGSLVSGAFLVKYSSAGFVEWLASQRATQASRVNAVAVDSSGNAYVGGSWGSLAASSSLSVYNANGTLFGTFPSATQGTAWIAKYNSSGDVQWIARPAVGPAASAPGNPSSVYGLAVDSSGNLYVVGSAANTSTITAYNANGTAFGTTISVAAGDAFITKYNSSGSVQWITKIASATSDQANAITVDSRDNVYVVGTGGASTGGTITAFSVGGGGFATTIVTTVPVPFIVKYNTSGTVQAVLKMLPASGGTGGQGLAVATDRLGSFIVGGTWATNTTYLTTITDAGGVATVTGGGNLAKFNASGSYQWAQRWDGTNGSTYVNAIATDSNCDILVGGSVSTTGSIYDVNSTVYGRMPIAPGAPPYVLYLVKYSSAAMPQWIAQVQFSTTSRTRGGVSTDSSGNVYVTMASRATVTPYSVDSIPKSLVTPGGTAFGSFAFGGTLDGILVVKYSSAGVVQWMARITSTSNVGSTRLFSRTDPDGNTYVAFYYSATVTARSADGTAFGTTLAALGSGDVGLVKYDTNGTVQWVARMGSTSQDFIGGLFVDSNGTVYLTGQAGAATFTSYSSSGTAFSPTLASRGSGDVFLVKYDTNGTVQWNARVASVAADYGMGITCDSAGNVIVTGYCNSGGTGTTAAYNASGTAFATTIAQAGSGDVFVVKYNSAGAVQWVARISTTTALDYGFCVATDSANNIYVGGQPGATGTVTVLNAGGGTRTFPNNLAGVAGFIVKFNSSGVSQWIAYGNNRNRGSSQVFDLVVDSSDRIYALYANSGGLLHFDAGGAVAGVTPTATSTTIVGLNTSGITSWITPIPATTAASNPPTGGPFLAGDSSGNFYVWCVP